MITISLLHPTQSVPVQSWAFEPSSVIRIGRSQDNDVVVYSAVVSRHHIEIRKRGEHWEIVSFGSNGTYIGSELVTEKIIGDGTIIRLGNSGPKIQIRFGVIDPAAKVKKAGEKRSPATLDATKSHPTLMTKRTYEQAEVNRTDPEP